MRLALSCLGEVSAARVVPNNFTHLPNTGAELLAFGLRPATAGAPREVLCAIDPSEDEIDTHAAALEEALAPEAVDRVTGEPLRRLVAEVTVDTLDGEGLHAARALVSPADEGVPGFLFGAFDRGSVLTYLGLAPPPLPRSDP